MKKLLFLITLFLISCKPNKNEATKISTNTIEVEENNVNTATTASKKKSIKKLNFKEAMETTSIEELKDYLVKNPDHENKDELKVRLIDLEVDLITKN